jgi:creatinine amidohydrolase
MIASFSLLTPEELEALPPELTVFLFPVGGVEQHGPHLPFGVKLLQAEELTKGIAEELQKRLPAWHFLVMPLLPLSIDTVTNRVALGVRPHVVRDAIVDQCEQLKRLGYRNFAVVSAHLTPKQLTALEDASRIVTSAWFSQKKAQLISVTGALVEQRQFWESPMIALPEEHGGEKDTGFMLHFAPSSVRKDYATLENKPRPNASVARFMEWLRNELNGYWGRPALANSIQAGVDHQRDCGLLAEKMIPWLERGEGQKQFLSPYRRYPVNGSFFKVYLLSGFFFLVMLLWILWGVRDVFEP